MRRDPMDETPEEMAADRKWALIETRADELEKEFDKSPAFLASNLDKEERSRFLADYARTVAERVAEEEYEQEEN